MRNFNQLPTTYRAATLLPLVAGLALATSECSGGSSGGGGSKSTDKSTASAAPSNKPRCKLSATRHGRRVTVRLVGHDLEKQGRYVPVETDYDFGDGATAKDRDLELTEHHTYRHAGSYAISATVVEGTAPGLISKGETPVECHTPHYVQIP